MRSLTSRSHSSFDVVFGAKGDIHGGVVVEANLPNKWSGGGLVATDEVLPWVSVVLFLWVDVVERGLARVSKRVSPRELKQRVCNLLYAVR